MVPCSVGVRSGALDLANPSGCVSILNQTAGINSKCLRLGCVSQKIDLAIELTRLAYSATFQNSAVTSVIRCDIRMI